MQGHAPTLAAGEQSGRGPANAIAGFTKKYSVHTLVWYQVFDTMPQAIRNEKQIKEWKRKWKLELIENSNPEWRDLYEDIA